MNNSVKSIKYLAIALIGTTLLAATLAAQAGTTITRYVMTDPLGNPVAKTDSTGAVIWRQSYTPYGEQYQQADPDGPGFTGHRNDAATGLVYMQARYYDPKIGRFLSVDPVGFSVDKLGHFNRYDYAGDNPINRIDSSGLDWYYVVSTGHLYEIKNGATVHNFTVKDYSGQGKGFNNPSMSEKSGSPDGDSGLKNYAAIQPGDYTIGKQQNITESDGVKLKAAMTLKPDKDNGHYGYILHGDKGDGKKDSSEGCIVADKAQRDYVGKSGDNKLHVLDKEQSAKTVNQKTKT